MITESKSLYEHFKHMKLTFNILKKYRMKLNPNKCVFKVGFKKFLGFMVSQRRIESNLEKIKALLKIHSPVNIKEA